MYCGTCILAGNGPIWSTCFLCSLVHWAHWYVVIELALLCASRKSITFRGWCYTWVGSVPTAFHRAICLWRQQHCCEDNETLSAFIWWAAVLLCGFLPLVHTYKDTFLLRLGGDFETASAKPYWTKCAYYRVYRNRFEVCGFCVSGDLTTAASHLGRNDGIYWIGAWVGPRAILDILEKRKISCPCWDSNPRPSSP